MNSFWIESQKNLVKDFKSLDEDIECDVCLIGGGITAITTAYYLSKAGLKVAILEKDKLAMQTTGHTTAKITSQHGLFYSYLIQTYGHNYAKSYLEANENAIDRIEEIINEENISCDFERTDAYVYTKEQEEVENIKKEVESVQSLGFPATFSTVSPLPMDILACIKFPDQAQFHPRKYLEGLVKSCLKSNVVFYENTNVIDVKDTPEGAITYTDHHMVRSRYAILTTKYPFKNAPGFYFLKMYQSTSYVIGIETNEKLFSGMYITSKEPTFSFRTVKNGDKELLLIGGSDHKTGAKIDLKNSYTSLEDVAKKMYPDAKTLYRWSTEDTISLDKIPYIGPFSSLTPHLFVATGFKKWGMTSSNVAAHLLCNQILGKDSPEQEVFLSTRFHPVKNHTELGNMIKESSYSLVINKLKDAPQIEHMNLDEGKILEIDHKKIGIYKDNDGVIHAVKPICSHLGCELSFNNLAKTWDCPCHGSTYDYDGHYIYGPTASDLAKIELSSDAKEDLE